MSGDNMHGKQPLKFYSEDLTVTKISLIDHLLKKTSENNNLIELEDKLKEWENLLTWYIQLIYHLIIYTLNNKNHILN
mgnify:CR=1 FL=1